MRDRIVVVGLIIFFLWLEIHVGYELFFQSSFLLHSLTVLLIANCVLTDIMAMLINGENMVMLLQLFHGSSLSSPLSTLPCSLVILDITGIHND